MAFTLKALCVLVAVILFAVAFVCVLLDVSNAKVYPEMIALGLAFGFGAQLVP